MTIIFKFLLYLRLLLVMCESLFFILKHEYEMAGVTWCFKLLMPANYTFMYQITQYSSSNNLIILLKVLNFRRIFFSRYSGVEQQTKWYDVECMIIIYDNLDFLPVPTFAYAFLSKPLLCILCMDLKFFYARIFLWVNLSG